MFSLHQAICCRSKEKCVFGAIKIWSWNRLSGIGGWASATKTGGCVRFPVGSNRRRHALPRAQRWTGARQRFTRSAAIDSPPVQDCFQLESSGVAHGASKRRWVPQITGESCSDVQTKQNWQRNASDSAIYSFSIFGVLRLYRTLNAKSPPLHSKLSRAPYPCGNKAEQVDWYADSNTVKHMGNARVREIRRNK